MPKLRFPVLRGPYKGQVGVYRTQFEEIASYADKSPEAKYAITTQMQPLLEYLEYADIASGIAILEAYRIEHNNPTATYEDMFNSLVGPPGLDADLPDIRKYGATGSASTLLPAINAMAADHGYAAIPEGVFDVGTVTINVPLVFNDGAALNVQSGSTLTIINRIFSNKQHIFRGDGTVRINISGSLGEDAKDVHVSWFGVFPTNTTSVDHTPGIQRALNVFSGQTREGTLHFDHGSYHVYGPIVVPRGVWVKGSGTRRTVFDVNGSGYDVFTTGNDAVRFSDLQFEQPSGSVSSREGALIVLAHTRCEAHNVWLWNSQYGIRVSGNYCTITNVDATYGVALDAASATILIQSAGCTVDGIKIASTGGGPGAIVRVGTGASGNFGAVRISNILSTIAAIPVLLDAVVSLSNISISEINFVGSGGVSTEALVKLQTSGAAGINNVVINGLLGNSLSGPLLMIAQGSTGVIENIMLDCSSIVGSTGAGVSLTRTAGTLRSVRIGSTVDILKRATPILRSGTMSAISVAFGVENSAGLYSGASTPEGNVTAVVGSMYTRTDGGANTTLYIKETGTGNTGWVAK